MPVLVSNIITTAEQSIYDFRLDTLSSYKLGLEHIKELEEYNNDLDIDMPEHYIFFPNVHEVILLAADRRPSLINEYLCVINDREKHFLLDGYLKICTDNPSYDKKNKIIKRLIEGNCGFVDEKNKGAKEKYGDLLRRILGI